MGLKDREEARRKSPVATLAGIDTDTEKNETVTPELSEVKSADADAKKPRKMKKGMPKRRVGRPLKQTEKKQRVGVSIYPSVYVKLYKLSLYDETTISAIMEDAFKGYLKRREEDLADFDRKNPDWDRENIDEEDGYEE